MRSPDFASTLYQILPTVYRNRDESGDLERYLAGCASLLDAVYETLAQRLADNFPDNPPTGSPEPACQDWLIPYFAELLDARLVSPLADGRRDEIAHAVRWRQGKGTAAVIESVFEALAQTEIVLQEGWQRVATTPRVDRPQRPASAFGYATEPEAANPSSCARHPDLRTAVIDVRCPSLAVATDEDNPGAKSIQIGDTRYVWRQASIHGAPCSPGSYDDLSPRTVDVRTPGPNQGHHHPKRVLAYMPPPEGFFPADLVTVNWSDDPSDSFLALIEIDDSDPTRTVYRNRSLGSDDSAPVRIRFNVDLDGDDISPGHVWRFEGLVFEHTINVANGRLELDRCAARNVVFDIEDGEEPSLDAVDSLLDAFSNPDGLSRLVYCSVLSESESRHLQASECLFMDRMVAETGADDPPESGCIRISRIAPEQDTGALRTFSVTRAHVELLASDYGDRHCAVLHAANSPDVLAGAEDGGEIGAYHHQYHALVRSAMRDKVGDFLAVGLEAVIIQDERLLDAPSIGEGA